MLVEQVTTPKGTLGQTKYFFYKLCNKNETRILACKQQIMYEWGTQL